MTTENLDKFAKFILKTGDGFATLQYRKRPTIDEDEFNKCLLDMLIHKKEFCNPSNTRPCYFNPYFLFQIFKQLSLKVAKKFPPKYLHFSFNFNDTAWDYFRIGIGFRIRVAYAYYHVFSFDFLPQTYWDVINVYHTLRKEAKRSRKQVSINISGWRAKFAVYFPPNYEALVEELDKIEKRFDSTFTYFAHFSEPDDLVEYAKSLKKRRFLQLAELVPSVEYDFEI